MTPKTEEELARCIREADTPFDIVGGGTRHVTTGKRPHLSTAGLSGISLYEPGALTIVAGAGTPLAEVEKALTKEKQILPFEPNDLSALLGAQGKSTVGGMVAENASGPRRVSVGACRDSLIGVRFVDGNGTVLKNGGRVMKNVTGYDLVKLMCGSHGTLGVLSEVAFKVLPKPDVSALLVAETLSDTDAIAALTKALSSPYEITLAAHLPTEGQTILRIEGFEGSVAYRLDKLLALLGDAWTPIKDPKAVDPLVRSIKNVEPLSGGDADIWRIICKPTDAPGLVADIDPQRTLYDWGGGQIWVAVEPGADLRSRMQTANAHATRMRGSGSTPRFHPEAPVVANLSKGLKARFDPRGLFNPDLSQ